MRTLNTHQKMALAIVVVIGTATLLFDAISLRKSIILPFFRSEPYLTIKTSDQIEKDRIEALKKLDTDKDGLSDYDELYAYRTSPYLDDSDSDGILDGIEISQNTDPNCPEGRECRVASTKGSAGGAERVPVSLGGEIVMPPSAADTVAPSGEGAQSSMAEAVVKMFGDPRYLTLKSAKQRLDSLNVDELRKFYIDLGLPSSLIQGADETLLKQLMLDTLRDSGVPEDSAPPAAQTPGAETPPASPEQ